MHESRRTHFALLDVCVSPCHGDTGYRALPCAFDCAPLGLLLPCAGLTTPHNSCGHSTFFLNKPVLYFVLKEGRHISVCITKKNEHDNPPHLRTSVPPHLRTSAPPYLRTSAQIKSGKGRYFLSAAAGQHYMIDCLNTLTCRPGAI
jgi:hypothetical protein